MSDKSPNGTIHILQQTNKQTTLIARNRLAVFLNICWQSQTGQENVIYSHEPYLSISSFCFSFLLWSSSSNIWSLSRSSLTSWSSRLWRRWGLGTLRWFRCRAAAGFESLSLVNLLISKWLKSLDIVLFKEDISSGPAFLACEPLLSKNENKITLIH